MVSTVFSSRSLLRHQQWELPATRVATVCDAPSVRSSRYMVLPRRPEGTEHLDEAKLTDLVTRKGLIGTAAV